MFLHSDEWPWLLNIYNARLLQICCMPRAFVTCTPWILIKVALWLSSGFYSASKALSTPLPCIMIIVLLKSAFLFFVLTSGRPLRVTTFFVFSKPLCSHFAAQIVIPEFSAPLQQRCSSLSKGFPLQPNLRPLQPALLQLFCSASWSHSSALRQRCSFRTGTDLFICVT